MYRSFFIPYEAYSFTRNFSPQPDLVNSQSEKSGSRTIKVDFSLDSMKASIAFIDFSFCA